MVVLTINAGSSSVKYSLFSMPEEERLAKGIVDRGGDREGDSEPGGLGPKVGAPRSRRDIRVGGEGDCEGAC